MNSRALKIIFLLATILLWMILLTLIEIDLCGVTFGITFGIVITSIIYIFLLIIWLKNRHKKAKELTSHFYKTIERRSSAYWKMVGVLFLIGGIYNLVRYISGIPNTGILFFLCFVIGLVLIIGGRRFARINVKSVRNFLKR